MKLSQLNEWLSLLANLGVLVGIVVLVFEINQNTAAQRVTAAQQVLGISATTNNNLFAATLDSDFEGFFTRDPEELSEEELGRFGVLALSVFANHWQVFYQHRVGFMDEEIFEAYDRRTRALIAQPLYRQWWDSGKFRFSDSFQTYVDGIIAEYN